jgi:hypothetical protein
MSPTRDLPGEPDAVHLEACLARGGLNLFAHRDKLRTLRRAGRSGLRLLEQPLEVLFAYAARHGSDPPDRNAVEQRQRREAEAERREPPEEHRASEELQEEGHDMSPTL